MAAIATVGATVATGILCRTGGAAGGPGRTRGVWVARMASARQERELAARTAAEVATSYRAVIDEVTELRTDPGSIQRRTLGRLRRELRRIGQRDYFPPPDRDEAVAAVAG